jgi:hypothetical protein
VYKALQFLRSCTFFLLIYLHKQQDDAFDGRFFCMQLQHFAAMRALWLQVAVKVDCALYN